METEGFTFGTEQYLQWQKMLTLLPEDLTLSELKTYICPIIAGNEREQVLVYRLYDDCLAEIAKIDKAAKTAARRKKWRNIILMSLALLVGGGIAYWFSPSPEEKTPVLSKDIEPSYLSLSPNETKTVCIKSNKLAGRPTITTATLLNQNKLDPTLGTPTLSAICLEYKSVDKIGKDTFEVQLTDEQGGNWLTTYYVEVREIELDTITRQVLVKRAKPEKSTQFATKDLPYPNDIRNLEVPPLSPLAQFYQDYAKLIKFLLLAILTAILAKILLARDDRRKKMIAQVSGQTQVTPRLGLPNAMETAIKSGNFFYRLLSQFRRRTTDEFYQLNIPKTISRTIKDAGMVNFQYQLQTRPSEYILIIDGKETATHLVQFFDLIFEYFQENDVHIERFYWDAKTKLAFNTAYPDGLSSEGLQHQFYQSKLMLLATDFSSTNTQKSWWKAFENWTTGSILLPVSVYKKAEHQLSNATPFQVVPATIVGLNFLLEKTQLAGGNTQLKSSSSELFVKRIVEHPKSAVAQLKKSFGDAMATWVAACAIYPSLHWNLTLQLGEIIADYRQEKDLLSIENLFDLVNLPWFAQNEIPEDVRASLLADLKEREPTLYEQLAQAVNDLFQTHQPNSDHDQISPEDAFMGMEKAIDKSENSGLYIDQKIRIPVVEKLTRKQQLLDFVIPKAWQQYLNKVDFPNLGMQEFWKDLLFFVLPIWLLFAGALWWLPEQWDNCSGEVVAYQYQGKLLALCIDQPQDLVLLQEYYARDAVLTDEPEAVDSLSYLVEGALVEMLSNTNIDRDIANKKPLEQAVASFYGNVGTTYYNQGVKLYKQSTDLEGGKAARDSLLDKVCYHFDRAIRFDTASIQLKKAVQWCLDSQVKSVNLQGRILDKEQGTPVANAKVSFQGQTVVTNINGQFNLGVDLKATTTKLRLKIRKTDYLSRTDTVAIQKIGTQGYKIVAPIYLTAKEKVVEKYKIGGGLKDKDTEKSTQGTVNIFVDNRLEATTENGAFAFELSANNVKRDKINIRFEGSDYEPLTQIINFDGHKDITLKVTLKPVAKKFVDAGNVASTVVGEDEMILDSSFYLLTTITETREKITPFSFNTPIPKMELLEEDTFLMGDVLGDKLGADEEVHKVAVNSYYLGTNEVTYEEFDRFCQVKKRPLIPDYGWGRGRQPVAGVSWYQAIEYCNWLSMEHGYEPVYTIEKEDPSSWTIIPNWTANGYRLPTEAEWEFAARQGGQAVRFGNGINQADPSHINFAAVEVGAQAFEVSGINREKPIPVGSFAANLTGLLDMSGNVTEWCWDWYDAYETSAIIIAPKGAENGATKVVRGGGFSSTVKEIRTTARSSIAPTEGTYIGFRLCRGVN